MGHGLFLHRGLDMRRLGDSWGGTVPRPMSQTIPFNWLIRPCEERMLILSDTAFHAAEGAPRNLQLWQWGEWQDRMLVETGLAMLTLITHGKQVMHRLWASCQARLACTMAVLHVRVQWHGFQPYASGFVPRSMAELRW
jgi:hypothetical protein